MKICPTCQQTYTDESLNFCLNDGAVLNSDNLDQTNQPTVLIGQPQVAEQNPAFSTNQLTSNFPTNPKQNWGTNAAALPAPVQKKSKAWLWLLGVFGGLVLVGGLAVIGLIALLATIGNNDSGKNNPPKSLTLTDDFSKNNWLKANNANGNSEYRNGEFFVNSKQAGYLYVLVTGNKNFKTWDATTTITVRNVNGSPTDLGYGLVIHSNSLIALDKDYAFLIDSTKQSYRITQHQNRNEKTLIGWTKFPAIRSGTQINEIQVRDENGKMSMYINGQFANSITDTVGFKEGVTGIYAADAIPIAFSNLQLSK